MEVLSDRDTGIKGSSDESAPIIDVTKQLEGVISKKCDNTANTALDEREVIVYLVALGCGTMGLACALVGVTAGSSKIQGAAWLFASFSQLAVLYNFYDRVYSV